MIAQLDSEYIRTRPTKTVSRLISYALFEGRAITTRGRFINPLVFGLFAVLRRLPRVKRVDRPIFIIGSGRSGTTVLGKVMSMHRDVGFLNEPKLMWYVVHPEDDVFGNYGRGPARYRFDAEDATPRARRTAHRLLGAYLGAVLSPRALIKYPEFVFRIGYARAIFPDARFILIVRNGHDTCHSIERWSERLGEWVDGKRHDWWGVDNRKWRFMLDELVRADPELGDRIDTIAALTDHRDMAAVEWVVTMRAGLSALDRHPEHVRLVRYEDLVERPREALLELLAFCELPADETFLRYSEGILRPAPAYPSVEVHGAVREPFRETMRTLGYEVGEGSG